MIDKVANKGGLKGAGEAFTRRVAGGKTSRRRRRRDGASLSRNFLSSSSLSLHPLRGRPSLHFLALLLLASSDVLSVNAYEALLWLKSKAGTSGRLAGGRGRERILFFLLPRLSKGYISVLSLFVFHLLPLFGRCGALLSEARVEALLRASLEPFDELLAARDPERGESSGGDAERGGGAGRGGREKRREREKREERRRGGGDKTSRSSYKNLLFASATRSALSTHSPPLKVL